MTTPRPERPKLKHRKQPTAAAAQRSSAADLRKQLDQRTRELAEAQKIVAEALQQQTATAQVLKIISRSTFDLQTVFQTLVESAALMCEADLANIWRPRGRSYHLAASFGIPGKERAREANKEYLESIGIEPGRGSIVGRALLEKKPVQIYDVQADPDYLLSGIVSIGDYRTLLGVPLLREGEPIGVFGLTRCIVQPFTDKQIELVSTFADQAVIAIENTRLFEEVRTKTRDLQEALVHQTGSANILKVIASSPTDVKPVLEAIVESACELCNADDAVVHLREGEDLRYGAHHGTLPVGFERHAISRDFVAGRSVVDKIPVHIHDVLSGEGDDFAEAQRMSRQTGLRTILSAPMLRECECIGAIVLRRKEVHPFSDKQVALLESFADQAVIAIENVRLFDEVQAKTRDLEESLRQQTATSEVLQIISSSPGELEPVFQIMLENATRICGANFGTMYRYDGAFHLMASHNAPPALVEARMRTPVHLPPADTGLGRLERTKQVVHIHDITTESGYATDHAYVAGSKLSGARTILIVPMLKDAELVGSINIFRQEVHPFTDKQIELLSNFAKQAVIAIENTRLLTETREALERQTATAEVLQVINSSPGDLTPVFETILEKAHSLCAIAHGALLLYDGEKFCAVAVRGLSEAFAARMRQGIMVTPSLPHHRLLLEGGRFAQIPDWAEVDDPIARASQDAGVRTTLFIPLRRDRKLLGYISASRPEVRPFADKEIALLENFAAQGVIAMENARLITETREALERQTATAEILQVINSSPGDLAPVFTAVLEKATRLCGAGFAILWLYDGERFARAATHAVPAALADFVREPLPVAASGSLVDIVRGQNLVHLPDLAATELYHAGHRGRRAYVDIGGARTLISVALRKDNALLGAFNVYRQEVRPFSDKEIALVQNFAAQAVIAIENARLLAELRDRTADLARSVNELTATSDVLKIISRSSVELQTVLDTMVETVTRLCRADQANMFRQRDDMYHLIASHGLSQEAKEFVVAHPFAPGRGSLNGRVAMERRAVHIPDVLQDPEYTHHELQKIVGYRSILGVPLLRGDALIGIFAANRTRVDPFTPKEIELATTFADQAVIAIENARLFEELRDRQAELRVTFDNMGDGVVMFDATARLTAWNRNFQEMLELPDAFLTERPSSVEYFHYLAKRGEYSADLEAELSRTLEDTSRVLRFERTRPDGRVIEVRRNPVPGGGFVLIYADITERKQAEEAIRAARDAAESALRELQKTQASLVHAQKMAALGQLTAGIAHEIKNPLNFVNNFAGLSVELLEELKGATGEAIGTLDAGKRTEILETIGLLTGNLERIAEHGRRADGIVRGMLQHSRGSSSDWQATDLNALVEESLNLAYHGARAQDQNFNVALELDLDRNLAPIDVVPQDVSRVLLNLISNGFYAVTKRGREGDRTFRPALKIATREFSDGVEVRIRDNGVGIPPENREKLFQPFFTTKPTGEGTGLGLSISYEIITQQHGGTITVDSKVADFTEFTVRLPRRRHAVA